MPFSPFPFPFFSLYVHFTFFYTGHSPRHTPIVFFIIYIPEWIRIRKGCSATLSTLFSNEKERRHFSVCCFLYAVFTQLFFPPAFFSFFLDNLCVMAIFELMWGVSFFLSHHLVLADIKDIFFLDISILISGTMY